MVFGRKSLMFVAMIVIAVLGLAHSEPDVVHAQCSDGRILSFTLEPSGVVDYGTVITTRITATCGTVRLSVNGQPKDELGSPVLTSYIRTEEFPAGTLVFRAEVRDDNDPLNWDGTNNWEQTLVVRPPSGGSDSSAPSGESSGSDSSTSPSYINNDAPPGSNAQCGSNVSRLRIGDIAVVNNVTPSPAYLRNYPTTIASVLVEIPIETHITIVSGPVCDGNIIFWQSQYGGHTGYVAENTSRGGYDLVPNGSPLGGSSSSNIGSGSSSSSSSSNSNASNSAGAYAGECDQALPPSIPIGGRGHVPDDPNHTPTSLRSGPRLRSDNVIYDMPPFTEFTVTGEAVCIDSQRNGIWMVPVRLDDGTSGWTAYGYQGDIPWIEAVSGSTLLTPQQLLEMSDLDPSCTAGASAQLSTRPSEAQIYACAINLDIPLSEEEWWIVAGLLNDCAAQPMPEIIDFLLYAWASGGDIVSATNSFSADTIANCLISIDETLSFYLR